MLLHFQGKEVVCFFYTEISLFPYIINFLVCVSM